MELIFPTEKYPPLEAKHKEKIFSFTIDLSYKIETKESTILSLYFYHRLGQDPLFRLHLDQKRVYFLFII